MDTLSLDISSSTLSALDFSSAFAGAAVAAGDFGLVAFEDSDAAGAADAGAAVVCEAGLGDC